MPKNVKSIENIVLEKYHHYKNLKENVDYTSNPNIEGEKVQDNVPQENDLNHVENIDLINEQTADEVISEINELQKSKSKELKKLKKKFKKNKRNQAKTNNEEIITNVVKETKCDKALSYLKLWKKHRDQWKFQKILHIWLLKNWKNTDKFPDKRFKIFLKYLHAQENKSQAIERIKNDAQKLIENSETPEHILERSRSILQWLI